ncbi:MAG: hypothetical protein V1885_01375 [Candidatus Brennerbacteria bacterium]
MAKEKLESGSEEKKDGCLSGEEAHEEANRMRGMVEPGDIQIDYFAPGGREHYDWTERYLERLKEDAARDPEEYKKLLKTGDPTLRSPQEAMEEFEKYEKRRREFAERELRHQDFEKHPLFTPFEKYRELGGMLSEAGWEEVQRVTITETDLDKARLLLEKTGTFPRHDLLVAFVRVTHLLPGSPYEERPLPGELSFHEMLDEAKHLIGAQEAGE